MAFVGYRRAAAAQVNPVVARPSALPYAESMGEPTMKDEPDQDATETPEPADDREAMERIAAEMADLLHRMAEFQKEMAPFLPLLDEPEEPPTDAPEPSS